MDFRLPELGEGIYEAELVAVIGRRARHVREEHALDHVLGYTCGNDVSDRVLQRRESAFGCLLAVMMITVAALRFFG